MDKIRVLGLDASRIGWAGVVWDGSHVEGVTGTSVAEVMTAVTRQFGTIAVLAIDIPIGLPDTTSRRADAEARARIGKRASSVFTTPVRAAVTAATYPAASDANFNATGKRISKQAYALRAKVLEVDAFVTQTTVRVVEVHPEVCFAEMNGAPLPWAKKNWSGMDLRRRLLTQQGLELPADLGRLGEVTAVDDVLDAAAAAWSAMRVALGTAYSLPDPPERFSDGIECTIWV